MKTSIVCAGCGKLTCHPACKLKGRTIRVFYSKVRLSEIDEILKSENQ